MEVYDLLKVSEIPHAVKNYNDLVGKAATLFRKYERKKEIDMAYDGFIVVDLETTGLDEHTGFPLEIGMARYDKNLVMVDLFQSLIYGPEQHNFCVNLWPTDDFAFKMHEKSGLNDDLKALNGDTNEFSVANVKNRAIEWLGAQGVRKVDKVPMTGSSVAFDQRWLLKHIPSIEDVFGYRLIDPSGMLEYVKIVAPSMAASIEKERHTREEHRVVPDIQDTVELLRLIRKHGGVVA